MTLKLNLDMVLDELEVDQPKVREATKQYVQDIGRGYNELDTPYVKMLALHFSEGYSKAMADKAS